MIVDLPDTTTSNISKALVKIREEGGAVALGRVLTLIIATHLGQEEEAIEAANDASREHPMRVIVVSTEEERSHTDSGRLDAQIRVGGDAGASEVIVLRAYGETASDEEGLVTGLLLPDAPVVVWWPGIAPARASHSPLGRIATIRITDASAQPNPQEALFHLSETYTPGDTDFAWTRLTLWRAQLAAVLDQPPYEPITAVEVAGAADSPSTLLLAAWLLAGDRLRRHPRRHDGARVRHDRARARSAERGPPLAAGSADPRPVAPAPQPPRLPGGGTA